MLERTNQMSPNVIKIDLPSVVDNLRNQPSPAALMSCAQAPSGICVEEFIEREVVLPIWIEV